MPGVSDWVSEWVLVSWSLTSLFSTNMAISEWCDVVRWYHWPVVCSALVSCRSLMTRSSLTVSTSSSSLVFSSRSKPSRTFPEQSLPKWPRCTDCTVIYRYQAFDPARPDCTWCGDRAGNTVEENCSIFSVVAVSKGTWTVQLCFNKILQLLTGGAN